MDSLALISVRSILALPKFAIPPPELTAAMERMGTLTEYMIPVLLLLKSQNRYCRPRCSS